MTARGRVCLHMYLFCPPKTFTRLRISHNPTGQQLGCCVRCQDSILDPAFSRPVTAEHSWQITATGYTSGSKISTHSDVEQVNGFPHLECQPRSDHTLHEPLSMVSRVSCLPPHFGLAWSQHLQDKTSLTEAGHNYAKSRQVRCYWSEAPSNTCALYLSVVYARFLPTVYIVPHDRLPTRPGGLSPSSQHHVLPASGVSCE